MSGPDRSRGSYLAVTPAGQTGGLSSSQAAALLDQVGPNPISP